MAKVSTTTRYGTSYYVSPRRYRYYYRGLPDWEQKWHRYERQHPTDPQGFPRDEHSRRTISVGSIEALEAIMHHGADGKVGDPLAGILVFRRLQDDAHDSNRIHTLKVDETLVNPLPDPVGYLRLCALHRCLARQSPERLIRLLSRQSMTLAPGSPKNGKNDKPFS